MRIVFLLQASSTVLKGGTEIQADLISNEILMNGHEVYFVSDLMGTPREGRRNVKYFYLKSYGRRYSALNFLPLIRALKNINPDIIYQRWRVAYTGIAAWYSKKYSKKMIFNLASDSDTRKNKIALNHMFLPGLINEYLGRYGIQNANLIIAQTHNQHNLLNQNFNRDSVVILSGHPVPQPPFKKSSPPIILWISNIKPLKQLEIFFNLAKELEYTNAKFFYIGRSSNGAYQKIINYKAKNIKNIRYLGELSLEGTNKLISKASVLVNTSIREGFPNTFIQAWMRETPVVSLNVDPDNLLEKRKIGFYSRNFIQLVKDVKLLIVDKEKRLVSGRRARQYAIENHDIKKIGEKYLNFFEDLVNIKK